MGTLPVSNLRRSGRVIHRSVFVAIVAAVALGGATTASAGLIGTTYDVRLDGHVRNAAGTVLGVEGHSSSQTFDANHSVIPATINPPAPLLPALPLWVSETEASLGGDSDRIIIWIRGENGMPDTFANPLDPNFLVEFEAVLRWDDLDPGEMINVSNIRYENFGEFFAPVTTSVTGKGTQAEPLRVLLGLSPADVGQSTEHVKILFDTSRDAIVIPEPASCLLLLGGSMMGWIAVCQRRRTCG